MARFIVAFYEAPRCGQVYNLGGGRVNSCSILEAFERASAISGQPMRYEYIDKNREGDHLCYISNLQKIMDHYPQWRVTKSLDDIFEELHQAWRTRLLQTA